MAVSATVSRFPRKDSAIVWLTTVLGGAGSASQTALSMSEGEALGTTIAQRPDSIS